MDSKDLTTAQAQAISKLLFHSLNYLCRLKSRMEDVGFKADPTQSWRTKQQSPRQRSTSDGTLQPPAGFA
jgi:hypothetical protein